MTNLTKVLIIIGFIFACTVTLQLLQTNTNNINVSTTEIVLPEPTNYVVNQNGALKQETVDTLNQELKDFDGTAQIAVLVLDSTEPLTIEEYGIKLADKWKVGYADKDNGAIIILATKDRKVRIEVGYGLEGDITDSQAGRILDNVMIPFLKESKWDDAVIAGVHSLKTQLTK